MPAACPVCAAAFPFPLVYFLFISFLFLCVEIAQFAPCFAQTDLRFAQFDPHFAQKHF